MWRLLQCCWEEILKCVDKRRVDQGFELIDQLIDDLSATEIVMFVGRRADEGDHRSFVVQTGEDGRCRIPLPDIDDPRSVVECAERLQKLLAELAGRPLPRCPLEHHDHALRPEIASGRLSWLCPEGTWCCRVGDYLDASWPQASVPLAPLLMRRIQLRGLAGPESGLRTLSVTENDDTPVAVIGVEQKTDALVAAFEAVAAPLQVEVHEDRRPLPSRC
jgi:hypothetical protein